MSRQQIDFPVQQHHIATPPPPPAGALKLYPKSDNVLYKLTSAGVESAVGVIPDPLVVNNATVNQVLTVGQRIKGDFSNSTLLSRTLFQTTMADALTEVVAIPSGTATGAWWEAYNSSDPANSAGLWLGISNTQALIQTAKLGTGAYVPLAFNVGGAERMKIAADGAVTIPGTLGVTGAISGSNVNLTGQLSMPQGNAVYWADTNSRVMSSGRTMYFDEYNAGWNWRNSATSFSSSMSLTGAGALTMAGALSVGGAVTSAGKITINAANAQTIANAAGHGTLEVAASGGGASMITFHRPGYYATNFGIDTDNILRVGGWSMGAVSYKILDIRDYAETATASKLVMRNGSGYIYANYINLTADVPGSAPAYVAGQNGDGFLRWYPKSLVGPPALNWAQFTTSAAAAGGGAWTNCTIAGTGNSYVRNDSSQATILKPGYYSIFAAGGGYYAVGVRIYADAVVVASQTGNSNDYCPCGTGWTGYVASWVQIHRYGGVAQGAAAFQMTFVPTSTYPG